MEINLKINLENNTEINLDINIKFKLQINRKIKPTSKKILAYIQDWPKNWLQWKLTQFQGGKMKREFVAENLWMNGFWNRRDTTQKV